MPIKASDPRVREFPGWTVMESLLPGDDSEGGTALLRGISGLYNEERVTHSHVFRGY
jgi:hypothetical protein